MPTWKEGLRYGHASIFSTMRLAARRSTRYQYITTVKLWIG